MDDVVKAMTAQYGQVQPDPRISVEDQRTLAGAAVQHRHAEPELLRAHQPAEAARRHRHRWRCIRRTSQTRRPRPIGHYDTFLKAAEACQKAGYAVRARARARPVTRSTTPASSIRRSARNWSMPRARSPSIPMRCNEVLDYARKLAKFLPPDTVSYDDASNNRALISGQSALIMNPPSAWSVAKRDAPKVAEDCWTFPCPAGPKGRFNPYNYCFFGVVGVRPEQDGGEGTDAQFLQERPQVEERDTAANGYDLPPLISMSDFEIWSEVEPPKGTVYNYPMRPWHDAHENITALSGAAGHRGADVRRAPFIRRCWPRCIPASRTRRSSPGRRTSWKASFAEALRDPPVRRCPDRRAVRLKAGQQLVILAPRSAA